MNRLAHGMCLSLVLASIAMAQEVNDAGGALTSHGNNPGFIPFFTSSRGSMALEVGGANNELFSMVVGERAAVGICPPILNGECFELDLASTTIPVSSIVDGFAGDAFGVLDPSGRARFAFPAAGLDGLNVSFQSIVADATNPPINLNMTAVCEYEISNTAIFQGDDAFVRYHFPSGTSYRLYGQSFSSVTVSTNGWVKMGGGCTFSDFSESSTDLFNGSVGGAPGGEPVVAALWNDLDMGNHATQSVRVREVQVGAGHEVRVSWINADLFPATPIGRIDVTIKSSGTVEIDHTGLNTNIGGGIVGLSSGENAGGTTIANHDFYNSGTAPNSFFSSSFRNTIYRNYNVSGPDTPSNLYTLCFQPQNLFGAYDMVGIFIAQSCL